MRLRLAVALVLCSTGLAETRTYPLTHAQDPQHLQEIATAVRSIGEIQKVSVDVERRTLTVDGTPAELESAGWLVAGLDQLAGAPGSLQTRDTRIADPRAPLMKIFYPAHIREPLQLRELVDALRFVADLQRVVAVTGIGAVAVRGTSEQVTLADWIAREIDRAAGGGPRTGREYAYPDEGTPPRFRATAVRLYYPQMTEPLELMETMNLMRALGDVNRAVVFSKLRAIAIRSGEESARLADWLLREFDQTPSTAGPHEYRWPARTDGIVRVVYLPKDADLLATWKRVRETTGSQRVAVFHRRRALIIRGTAAEIAAFDRALL